MPINFDKALGSHERALMIQARRSSLIAGNIANAETPNYKAQDIDFKQALKKAQGDNMAMQNTHPGHIKPFGINDLGMQVKFRTPMQPSLDGNTVDLNMEKSAYSENAVRYQTTLRILGGRFKGMINAFKGE